MSEQIIRRAGRVVRYAQSAMPWLVAAGVYVLLLTLGPRLLADPDTYSHIALGRWILEHHTVPTADPFSATLPRNALGRVRVAVANCVYASAYAIGGWIGVVAVAAAAAAAAFGLLTRFLLREWQPTADTGRGARRFRADGAAHSGAAAYAGASGDGGMGRDADPRGRYTHARRRGSCCR